MFKIEFDLRDGKHFVETETEEEILSAALDAFNNNGLLYHIYNNEKTIYSFKEIYDLIGKAFY